MRFVERNFHLKEFSKTYGVWVLAILFLVLSLIFIRYTYVVATKNRVAEMYSTFTKNGGLFDIQNSLADDKSLVYRQSILIQCEYVALQLEKKIDCSDYEKLAVKDHRLISKTELYDIYAIAVLRKTREAERKIFKEMSNKDRRDILKLQDFYINLVGCVEGKECHKDSAVENFGEAIYGYVNRFCAYLAYDAAILNQKPEDDDLVHFLINNRSKLPEKMFEGADGAKVDFGFRCRRHVKLLPEEMLSI